jgi:peptidyl-prolyl cis-trans isomerase A (cyclophilin A)
MTRAVFAAVLAAAIIAGVAAGCGGGGSGGGGGGSSSSTPSPSSLHAQAPATFSAQFDTTKGPFVVDVTRSWAPKGADRFYNLVRSHFYDNQPIFRVIPGFVAQWGISGTPAVAKAWQNATIKDDPVMHSNDKGTITFATSGANSRTTQLFVNLAANSQLDSMGFSPFGTITSGLSVFDHLYSGYGEDASNEQPEITNSGASWVHQHFPKLDWIKTARIVQ